MEFHAINPATGEQLDPVFRDATTDEIDLAGQTARGAAGAVAAVAPDRRAAFLEAIGEGLMQNQELIERAHLETGFPVGRLEGERGRTVGQLRLFAKLVREGSWVDARIDRAQPERKPMPRVDLRRMLRPIGPVAVFGASNFPLAFSVAGGDTASALAAGNPVIVKAHQAHPGTSEITANVIRAAARNTGMVPGVFAMIHGSSPEVSLQLVRHSAIEAVGFTGSTKAGRALFDAAGARPKPIPVFAEMSSLNPVFLLPDAVHRRGKAIAEGLAGSVTLGVGQFCTKPGLVFARKGAELDRLKQEVTEILLKADAGIMLHAGIASAFEQCSSDISQIPGVVVFARSPAVQSRDRTPAQAASVTWSTYRDRPEFAKEVFGPFVLFIELEDDAQFAAAALSLDGQLTAAVHHAEADAAHCRELARLLAPRIGRLVFNGFPTGVEVSPAMHHGGPYPATTDVRFTSVGTAAILRFARPICYQDCPHNLLPDALRNENPLKILRLVDGQPDRNPIPSLT